MIGTVLLLLAAVTAAAGDGIPLDPEWGRSTVWDDGRAEVAHYEARRHVYGVERSFETIVITVKEDFDRARGVKADPPYGDREILTVIKTNIVSTIQTDNYPYHYMTSLFVRRDDPARLVKLAQSSQEWCGTTFKEIRESPGAAPRLEYHSYFDGQGDGSLPLDLGGGALLEEQLMVVLRASALKEGERARVRLYDPLITHTAQPVAARPVAISAGGLESVVTGAGIFETRRFEIRDEGSNDAPRMTWWIGTGPGRPMVRMESRDGRRLDLKSISRRDYWSRP